MFIRNILAYKQNYIKSHSLITRLVFNYFTAYMIYTR